MIATELTTLLIARFDAPHATALVLMGSHAQGTATEYSDVDLLRLVPADAVQYDEIHSSIIAGRLVNITDIPPGRIEAFFTEPELASSYVAGLRRGHVLVERSGAYERIRARANGFVWDETLQEKANRWASDALVGWSEEAHKGLQGLRDGSVGRLLEARFGLSWGLGRVMQVQRGVLLRSGNDFYDAVAAAVGVGSRWVALRRIVFAIESADGRAPTLHEQVTAGLRLYVETARLLNPVIMPDDREVISHTVQRIKAALGASALGLGDT